MQAHDHLHWLLLSHAPDLYSFNVPSEKSFPMRMVALRLNDGSFLVYSPVPKVPSEALENLKKMGPVSVLLASNHFHNLGIKEYLKHFPKARIATGTRAIPRLKKVVGLDFFPLDRIAHLLPAGVSIVEPPGLKTGEVWISCEGNAGTIWVTSDAFMNMPQLPRGIMALFFKLFGTAPGLRVSRIFRMIGIEDKHVYRDWLKRALLEQPPKMLVPSHGELLADTALLGALGDLI